ncbi:MAG: 50S ribosomal protein L21 [Lachnospiraceae bacterium]|nr:50S ribosomal protein L21 [Lachnospiraceae bacterium]
MYAIIATGGKQYKVSEGDLVNIEKIDAAEGDTVSLDVLAVSDGKLVVGSDAAKAKVSATVVEQGRGKKVVVYRYKRKSGYHKKNGHRQPYTQVKIDKIEA